MCEAYYKTQALNNMHRPRCFTVRRFRKGAFRNAIGETAFILLIFWPRTFHRDQFPMRSALIGSKCRRVRRHVGMSEKCRSGVLLPAFPGFSRGPQPSKKSEKSQNSAVGCRRSGAAAPQPSGPFFPWLVCALHFFRPARSSD